MTRELTTRLILRGTVAERHKGRPVNLAQAMKCVGDLLKSLEEETELFRNVEVNKYPSPEDPVSARTFKMTVTFAAPYYGATPLEIVKR